MAGTLFANVQVLSCTGEAPFFGDVLIEKNRIARVTRNEEAIPREGHRVVEGQGTHTLMPGLIESHSHLSINNTDDLRAIGLIPPEESTLITMHNAKFYLDCGITGCISAAAAKPRLDVVIRN